MFALAALLLALAAAPAANAGQASVQGTTVVYTDSPGDSRAISWARDSGSIAITETLRDVGSKVSPTAGAGCTAYQPNNATATYVCTGDGLADVRIELGDGNDSAEAAQTSAFN
ncbi:MAG: hypothetical protein QOI11_209, partial [Candidatus Eremiobacteraeota bacterium]|nr:hypothetical protein [Candidatus Eremiobacteraeota bacterium]